MLQLTGFIPRPPSPQVEHEVRIYDAWTKRGAWRWFERDAKKLIRDGWIIEKFSKPGRRTVVVLYARLASVDQIDTHELPASKGKRRGKKKPLGDSGPQGVSEEQGRTKAMSQRRIIAYLSLALIVLSILTAIMWSIGEGHRSHALADSPPPGTPTATATDTATATATATDTPTPTATAKAATPQVIYKYETPTPGPATPTPLPTLAIPTVSAVQATATADTAATIVADPPTPTVDPPAPTLSSAQQNAQPLPALPGTAGGPVR